MMDDQVRDAMHDIKQERAGERKTVYVKPSMWGEIQNSSDWR